ncbi:hypothetical protein AB0J38_00135 [Streptomyces sp. NPDC050095]|uniref:hypothetical protein n=1 Tax=unclassified Streptomyces TaxID=2593676 RepID=UPI003438FBA4
MPTIAQVLSTRNERAAARFYTGTVVTALRGVLTVEVVNSDGAQMQCSFLGDVTTVTTPGTPLLVLVCEAGTFAWGPITGEG